MKIKTLLIDNYDSFSYNLYQLLWQVNREPPIVVKNDAASWEEISTLSFDNIVISPGPGRPDNPRDFGVSREAILNATVPLFGICLGHQGICQLLGGKLEYAKEVVHGQTSPIHHTGTGPFWGIPSPFNAVRYHSLYIPVIPTDLEACAWTIDGMLMGVTHHTKPIWGVQFHPESICTEYGERMLENFLRMTQNYVQPTLSHRDTQLVNRQVQEAFEKSFYVSSPDRTRQQSDRLFSQGLKIFHKCLSIDVDPEQVFLSLYANSNPSFWLDSSLLCSISRFSYMGDAEGPYAEVVSYRVSEQKLSVTSQGKTTAYRKSIFDYLDHCLQDRYTISNDLPFNFNLGYVGYLGYEVKAECGGDQVHQADTPDAQFIFSDRLIVIDHQEKQVHLLCLDTPENQRRAKYWLDTTAQCIKNSQPKELLYKRDKPRSTSARYLVSPNEYQRLILKAQELIQKGESYEICLTNQIHHHVKINPLNTYRYLRSINPAPYSAYLKFPDVTVLCSSPERFLKIDTNKRVESKPIKGTRPRGKNHKEDLKLYQDLQNNQKDKAENLMIVDLLRNDLGSVCEVGSIRVSELFAVETYASVHQLVSTIQGKIRENITAIQCVKAAFPGGSMTGAPKKRTMEILDDLEYGARGIYSGTIGFLGLNGTADLNIVIRTIVCTQEVIKIGSGGAIVSLSDPGQELDEVYLKTKALNDSLAITAL